MPTLRLSIALLFALSLLLGPPVVAEPVPEPMPEPTPEQRFHALLEREWEHRLESDPLLATGVGRHEWDDRLPDVSVPSLAARVAVDRAFLEELGKIERDALSPADRISYDVLAWQLAASVEAWEHDAHLLGITSDTGFHLAIVGLPRIMPFRLPLDYERYAARLRALPRYFDQQIALLRRGLETGKTLPAVVLDGYADPVFAHSTGGVGAVEESRFWKPFEELPETLSDEERERIRAMGRDALPVAMEAYARLHRFLAEEYIPGVRTTLGASEMPGGEAYYRSRVRFYTTTELTPEEIHRIGRDEVARIRAEMDEVIASTGFQGTFDEFLVFLRTDPRFYAEIPEELLKEAAYLAKKMDGQLPRLFGRLPRQPYGVEPVPDYLAPKYTAGRYVPASIESTKAGTYWVNTHDLPSRPLYALEALTLHEAVPGHHLQIALAQELDDLPPFRRELYLSAFGEGWGLYAERLGLEAGFYEDPYSDFGRLTYEMWRACRLVVDTGIHAMGWSRQEAVDYLASNTALSLHEVETEIDRYISWPGQALAYKIGELKIRQLRQRAEERLGPAFDVREFHDVVLGGGAVPLTVLERVVDGWIEGSSRS